MSHSIALSLFLTSKLQSWQTLLSLSLTWSLLTSSLLCVLCCFLELFFDDELPRNDLDVCVSTGVPPVSVIGNSYTLITIYTHKKDKKCRAGVGANTNR